MYSVYRTTYYRFYHGISRISTWDHSISKICNFILSGCYTKVNYREIMDFYQTTFRDIRARSDVTALYKKDD